MPSTSPHIRLPRGAWMTVGVLFVVGLLNYLDRIMLVTMRESVMDSIPMSEAQFGLLTSMFLWVYALLSPFAGFIADRFKRSHVIIASLFVWSLLTWLTGHAATYNQLLMTRALMGVSEAFYIPAALALIVDYHRGPTRSLATGFHLAGIFTGQSLGFMGGWIAEKYSWNLAFTGFGIAGLAYAGILLFILRDPARQNPSDRETEQVKYPEIIKNVFVKPTYQLLVLFWGVFGLLGWMIAAWLPAYYQEGFNLSQTMAGLYATAYLYPVGIVGAILSGWITDRWSVKNKLARITVPIIGLSIAAPCVFFAGITSVMPVATGFFMVYALTKTTADINLMPIMCLFIGNRYRATSYGVINMVATLAGGAGIYITGILRDSNVGMATIYQIAALCFAICVVLLYRVKKHLKLETIP